MSNKTELHAMAIQTNFIVFLCTTPKLQSTPGSRAQAPANSWCDELGKNQ